MSPSRKRAISTVIVLLLLISPVAAWSQRWQIFDWWRMRSYQASADIEALADRTTMTDYARRLFYVYRADLQDKEGFNHNCQHPEQTIVLGCYVSNEGIYIYNVTDPRLEGIKEVTAAHEVLHAAYERMSASEKEKINSLLLEVFNNLNNERIKKSVENYRDRDPAVVPNELHSIIGTEVREIGTELENYYSKYFHDRTKVVEFSERYEKAFSDRRQKVQDYEAEIKRLGSEIKAEEAQLNARLNSLRQERERLDELLRAEQYEQYNAAIPSYNASVSAYNAAVASVKTKITEHNRLVNERNAIATESNELIQAIDSRVTSIDTE